MQAVSNSPTKNLIPDILAKIFMHCLDIDTSGPIPIQEKPVLYLAQICFFWRSVALSTPLLWVGLPKLLVTPHDKKRRKIAYLKEQLKRSDPCPISFQLQAQDKASIMPILSVLMEQVHRWRLVSISTDIKGFSLLSRAFKENITTLELLRLVLYSIKPNTLSSVIKNVWEFHHLTKLVLGTGNYTCDVLTTFLGQLVTPSLQELRVECYEFDSKLVSQTQKLVLRSGCNLLHLSLRGHMGSSHNPGDLSSLLLHTPSLAGLEISHIETIDLEKLCLHNVELSEPLVPSLRHLSVYSVVNKEVNLSVLSKLGLSRCDFSRKMADGSIIGLDNHGCCALEILIYVPYTNYHCINVHEQLEGISIVESDPRLTLDVPWQDRPFCRGSDMIQICNRFAPEIDNLFTFLETYQIPGPEFFQTTRIHLHIHDVKVGSMQWYPDPNIPKRAAKILNKWKPMLMECVPKRRWGINGSYIQYVPLNWVIRESTDIIFGLWDCEYQKFVDLRFNSGIEWDPEVQAKVTALAGGSKTIGFVGF
ncbi:hypothetical protein BDQ17DRAFT_1359582 [Cyathus striatus]|nr:hypothetical protein BDQ17DRAFT_1359582 [Cyathus striatus]